MSSKRWTRNPALPKRYRPGKGEDVPSDDDYSEEEEDQQQQLPQPAPVTKKPPPAAPATRAFPQPAQAPHTVVNEDEFETESEDEEEGNRARSHVKREGASGHDQLEGGEGSTDNEDSDEESDAESEEESETSSEDEAPKMLRPTFIRKDQRAKAASTETPGTTSAGKPMSSSSAPLLTVNSTSEASGDAERRRRENDALIQDQIEKQAAARAAGKKYWDDDDENLSDEVDDTDGLDPEAELAAWKLRELKRVKRARDAIEAAEKEQEELDRRRNLTAEEREREDAEYLRKQKEDHDSRGNAGYMKRYHHRGAFYQDGDDETSKILRERDIMGSKFADDTNREVLPEYMRIRDMTKLGRKGRSKYKDLRSEDTGRWGQDLDSKKERWTGDERFAPEHTSRGPERSGANAAPVGERHRRRSRSRESRKRSLSPRNRDLQRDEKRRRREQREEIR